MGGSRNPTIQFLSVKVFVKAYAYNNPYKKSHKYKRKSFIFRFLNSASFVSACSHSEIDEQICESESGESASGISSSASDA